MAQQVKVLLLDDLDGSAADETVKFGLDGRDYEMDLTSEHASELREALAQYINVSRKLSKMGAPMKRTTVPPKRDTKAIRAWAQSHGHENLSDRGRIPEEIIAEYDRRNDKPEAPKVEFSASEDQEEKPKARRRRTKTEEPANA